MHKNIFCLGFPGGAVVKNLPANAGNINSGFHPWVGEISWRKTWQPPPVFLPEKSHGQRAWRATVHVQQKSWTQLSNGVRGCTRACTHTHTHTHTLFTSLKTTTVYWGATEEWNLLRAVLTLGWKEANIVTLSNSVYFKFNPVIIKFQVESSFSLDLMILSLLGKCKDRTVNKMLIRKNVRETRPVGCSNERMHQ